MRVRSIENNEDETARGLTINLIGIGGAGARFVQALIASGLTGVEFILADTAPAESWAEFCTRSLRLGDLNRATDLESEQAEAAARQSRQSIENAVAGADMVIIVAGMGGATGSGAAPVVAEIARATGALTVAFVTRPGEDEGALCRQRADHGVAALARAADSLFVVDRDAFDPPAIQTEAARSLPLLSDHVLTLSVSALATFLLRVGLICLDFEDVRQLMGGRGLGALATAAAAGEGRGSRAVARALASGTLSRDQLRSAKGVAIAILAAEDSPARFRMRDAREVMDAIHEHSDEEALCVFGTAYAELGEEVRVVVLACGVGCASIAVNTGMQRVTVT